MCVCVCVCVSWVDMCDEAFEIVGVVVSVRELRVWDWKRCTYTSTR